MSEKLNVIPPGDIDFYVRSLRKFQLADIGSAQWMDQHEILLKLHQQSTLEITSYQEEMVKELIIAENKLPLLVHELYSLLIWRTKILPRLMKIDSNPKASFIIYTVFFHEASVISLLENVLYYQSGYEALHDTVLDLIDYCVQAITQLIGLVSIGHGCCSSTIEIEENCGQELERQKRDILFKIGMRSLVILSYVADKSDVSSISTFRRLVQTHDTLCLLSEILHCKPWLRRTDKGVEKFIDDSWQTVTGTDLMKVSKVEAQTWFCLRQLLFNGNISQIYAITEFRQRELAKCVALMSDTLLDQLPPLIELKHYLCALTVSGNETSKSSTIMMEEIPAIKEEIIEKAKQIGYKEISEKQAKIFLNAEPDNIFAYAKRLQSAYNIDYLSNYEETVKEAKQPNQCGKCKKIARKKCSKCERVYYCSRECQVTDWPSHKIECQANN